MSKMATCVCGQAVQISNESAAIPVNCPMCGRVVETVGDQETCDSSFSEPAKSTTGDTAPAAIGIPEPPMLLRMLLDPTTIQRLLFFGGGLSVLGLIAWLVSLGVFDDPRILAVTLGVGSLTLLSSGWGVVLRTQYRLAGQALTFLACVIAPLNLWFYDAQGLLTVDGHLWMGGLVCSILYAMTVWKLRDPLFLYAVEAGITLTVLLLLGDLQRVTDSSALCLAMVVLAAISIHAEAAFDPNHPTFNRKRFGFPIFIAGQIQLAVGAVSLLSLQCLNWILHPTTEHWSHSQLASTPWLAGTLWLAAAYLWIYSDLTVRRFSVFSIFAALAAVLAEVSLLYPLLSLEVLIIAMSVTAAMARLLDDRSKESKSHWPTVTNTVATTVGVVAFAIGVMQHWQHANLANGVRFDNSSLFAVAMVTVAANLCLQGWFRNGRGTREQLECWICAGLSLWVGVMHGLDVFGVQTLVQQLPILMLIPLTILLLARRGLRQEFLDPAMITAHGLAILGLITSIASVDSTQQWSEFFISHSQDRSTLMSGLVFAELAVLFFATGSRLGIRWLMTGLGSVCSIAAGGKFLAFVDLPEASYGPILAGIGIVLTIIDRLQTVANSVHDQTSIPVQEPNRRLRWSIAGDLSLTLGELIGFFQTLPWIFGSVESIPVWSLTAPLFTAGIAVVGGIITSSRSMRGAHRFAAAIIVTSASVAWIRTQHLAPYQRLEFVLEFLGLAWLGMGFIGRLKETENRKDPWVSLALWVGSLCATLPVLLCTLIHRWSASGPSLGDELGLITITATMVTLGCILQISSTTTFGGLTLGAYLAVLFGHLAYHPQIAVGVYLAAGGAIIFLTGLLLSIYRDRLLALPSKIAHREGVFRVIDWR